MVRPTGILARNVDLSRPSTGDPALGRNGDWLAGGRTGHTWAGVLRPSAGSSNEEGITMATDVKTYRMFVNGGWVDSVSGSTRTIASPATGEVLGEVAEGGAEDVDNAVAAAKAAFETWYDATPGERMATLLKMADLVEEHADEIGRLESHNVGKPFGVTMSEEIPVIADQFRFFAGGARFLEGRATGEYMKGY